MRRERVARGTGRPGGALRLVLPAALVVAMGPGVHALAARQAPAPGAPTPPGGFAQPDVLGQPAPRPLPGPGPVTLDELLRRAGESYPSLVAARRLRQQAVAQAVAAGAYPLVLLNVGKFVGGDVGPNTEDILLSGRLELGGKRQRRMEAARAQVRFARAAEAQAGVQVAFQVRSAFAALQQAAGEERLAREQLALAQTFLRLAEIQFEVGDIPLTTVLRAEIEVENSAQAVTAAAAVTATQRAAMNVLIGADPASALGVPDAALLPVRDLDLPSLQRAALARPDVRAARALLAARQAAVDVARAAGRPDLTATAVHGDLLRWGPDQNGFRAGVEFPVFDWGLFRADAAAARAFAGEQRANLDLLERTVLQEVETAYLNLQAARAQAERLGGPQLDRARRLRDLAELGYREGEFSYLQFLDAQRAYLTTFTQYLRAVTAANTAEANLNRAIGLGLNVDEEGGDEKRGDDDAPHK